MQNSVPPRAALSQLDSVHLFPPPWEMQYSLPDLVHFPWRRPKMYGIQLRYCRAAQGGSEFCTFHGGWKRCTESNCDKAAGGGREHKVCLPDTYEYASLRRSMIRRVIYHTFMFFSCLVIFSCFFSCTVTLIKYGTPYSCIRTICTLRLTVNSKRGRQGHPLILNVERSTFLQFRFRV